MRAVIGDVQHADTKAKQDTLREDILVVLLTDTGDHNANHEHQGSWYHDYSGTVGVKKATDETSLGSEVNTMKQ